MTSWLYYLIEVSICQALFCLLYLGAFRNLSFFQANRAFLLSATLLSFIIPVLSIPFWSSESMENLLAVPLGLQNIDLTFTSDTTASVSEVSSHLNWILLIVSAVYLAGLFYRLWKLYAGISSVLRLTKSHEVVIENGIKAVHLNSGPSFFSFLNYIFINTNQLEISKEELLQVMEHEKAHLVQRHTLDNLLMEISILLCWFNPALRIMKKELNNVHEYYADAKASAVNGNIDSYSKLILKLASHKRGNLLTHQFSMNTIKKRIIMLNKMNYRSSIAMRYFLIAPCLMLLLSAFSFTAKQPDSKQTVSTAISEQVIGNITWEGNTLYTDEYLTKVLGMNTGDSFDEEAINKRFTYQPDGSDLTTLYMDQGYLFFNLEMIKEVAGDKVNLTFKMYEGAVVSVENVIIKGNDKVATDKILEMIDIKSGELFNRSKLISSTQKIAQSGLFNPEEIGINPIPNINNKTVDIEFVVVEL